MSVSADYELKQPVRNWWGAPLDAWSGLPPAFPVRAQIVTATGLTILMPVLWLAGVGPVKAAVALAAPMALALALRIPALICLSFVSFSFFRIHEAYTFLGPLRLPQLLAALAFGAIIWHMAIARSVRFYWSAELKALALVFGAITIGCFLAVDSSTAFLAYDAYWKVVAMAFAIAWLVRSKSEFEWTAIVLISAAASVALVACTYKFAGINLVEGSRVAIGEPEKSQIGDPNDLAMVLLFPFGYAVSLLVHRPNRMMTAFALVAAGLILLAIVFTQSRGGLLGLMAVLSVIGYQYTRSVVVVAIVGAAIGAMLYSASGIYERRSGGGAVWEELDESAAGRIEYWTTATRMARYNPLTGVGLNNFPSSYACYSSVWEVRGGMESVPLSTYLTGVPYCTFDVPGPVKATHSVWFQVLADHGYPGFALYMLMVVLTVLTAVKSLLYLEKTDAPPIMRATALAMVAGLAGFCMSGTFLSLAHRWPIYVLLGLSAGLGQYVRMRQQDAGDGSGSNDDVSATTGPTGPQKAVV